MNASNKVTTIIISIFVAVFLVLVVVMFHQARADIAKEGQSAIRMAQQLSSQAVPSDVMMNILSHSRHVDIAVVDDESNNKAKLSSFWTTLLGDSVAPVTLSMPDGTQLIVRANNHAELLEISATMINVLLIFVFALMLTLGTLRYAVKSRMKPLTELCSRLDSIKKGDYQQMVVATDIAEIDSLISHYNNLSQGLATKQFQVASLRQRIAALQENERQLLARELHDNLGQLMTGITVQTYMLKQQKHNPQYVEQACERIQQQCDAVHRGMKELTHQLYPVFLNRLGILGSLKELTQSWQDIHQIAVTWHCNCDSMKGDLYRDTQLYRIAQEALNNIAKHANATKVSVSVKIGKRDIYLIISDNGQGLTPHEKAAGLGLESMAERAKLLHGELTISSSQDGTTIHLHSPLLLEKEQVNAHSYR